MQIGLCIMLSIDFIAVLTDITLIHINRKRRRNRLMDSRQRYTLSSSYQLNENQCTTGIVLPVTITQSSCYLFYTCSSLLSRHMYPAGDIRLYPLTNFCYLFCQLSLLLATITFHKQYLTTYNIQKRKLLEIQLTQSTEQYFHSLNQHMNKAFEIRENL
ncbi:unnamed protein product [Bursaphelenchus okinawaensis]|uniref:7TM_GPCR_Srx domain-containing protein n=1 Tax=Bursaphelenchus okinawaensis TaxID=465554 RepID=A0A811LD11_9BILA|nr:unnamed protein product [Bursaphelenchus okinawaensis]CAG9121660.1 unnamed protein product [Bursaphelenchus okinawaensis]